MAYILNDPTIFGLQLNVLDVYRLTTDIFQQDFLAIRWIGSKGLLDEAHSQYAASIGNLECLQYLHKEDCPWDWRTCWKAAANGHPPASCRLIA